MTDSLHLPSTALVLIDLQHSNVARTLAPYSSQQVVHNAARLADAFRARGAAVVYVRVELTELVMPPADRAIPRPPGTPPANACDIVAEAGMQAGDALVTKRQWGALYATELDQLLRRKAIRTIVVGGIATNFGVESTARAALDRGYGLVFAEDAMSSLRDDMHAFSTQHIFPIMGKVRSTDQLLAALA